MSCLFCKRDVKIIARGYCRACYQRWQKRGTLEYAERHRNFCQIDDCGKPVVTNGMCDMHRQRLAKTGTTDQSTWGIKTKHPLYHSWAWMRRHAAQHPIDPAWDDFVQFAMDVGVRPEGRYKLYRADDRKPFGPGNFVWTLAITQKVPGEDEKTYQARAQRVYRKLRAEAYQEYDLKKLYGLTREQYLEMLHAQNHCCGICKQPEGLEINGKKVRLAVDHCHRGGHIRALLCSTCNRGLGLFRDDPALLQAAVAYLTHYAEPVAPI